MINLSQFAKKAGVAGIETKDKANPCLKSYSFNQDGDLVIVVDMQAMLSSKPTSTAKELYSNFNQVKFNHEVGGTIVGLRFGGNVYIGNAK